MGQGQSVDAVYHLGRKLGSGGFGAVCEVHRVVGGVIQPTTQCMKFEIYPTPDTRNKMLQEAALYKNLNHANIVSGQLVQLLLDSGMIIEGILMDIANKTLRDVIVLKTYYREWYVLRLLRDISRGLEYLHSHKLVHRDIKPENVLIYGETARLTDFGLVKQILSPQNHSVGAGTPGYLAPEVFKGETCDRSDCWALGVIISELVPKMVQSEAELVQAIWELQKSLQLDNPALRPTSAVTTSRLEHFIKTLRHNTVADVSDLRTEQKNLAAERQGLLDSLVAIDAKAAANQLEICRLVQEAARCV